MLKFKSGLNETIFGSYEIFLKQKGAYVLAIGARTGCQRIVPCLSSSLGSLHYPVPAFSLRTQLNRT